MRRIVGCLTVLTVFAHAQPDGRWSARIHMGQEPAEGQYPYMASINSTHANYRSSCTATILNDDTILTAAHCTTVQQLGVTTVYLGHVSNSNKNPDYEFIIKRFYRTVMWEKENKAGREESRQFYDVALLKLQRKIDFRKLKHVAPVCLAGPDDVPDGPKCIAIGWGSTEENDRYNGSLRWILNPIIPPPGCGRQEPLNSLQQRMICAGYDNPPKGQGVCFGDSGSPLMCPLKNKPDVWLQFAVQSHLTGRGCGKGPGLYVNITRYHVWIQEIAEDE